MNLKRLIYIIVGAVVFFSIWLFNMVGGISLLVGFGFGILLHNWLNEIFKNFQRNIYLSEKKEILHRKVELQAELNQLKKDSEE